MKTIELMKWGVVIALILMPLTMKAQKWDLVWADEFDSDGLPDSTNWVYEYGPPYKNNEKQFYAKEEMKYSRVENGMLILEAHKEQREGAGYVSASLRTQGKRDFLYGRLEARILVPKGKGTWPAFWMLGNNISEVGWPACGEIDIMEHVGFDPSIVHANIHSTAFNHIQGTNKGNKIEIIEPYNNFFVYATEWYDDKIDFFVNDVKYFSFEKLSENEDEWPFSNPHFLILNLAIGGDWGGREGIDDELFPHQFVVDYVRYYKLNEHYNEN